MNTVTRAKVVEISGAVKAALTNEQITRQRVEAIETFLCRSFLGRLRWLFLGK